MKKIVLISLIIAASFSKIWAQLPVASTEAEPVWYYVQVIGETDRADLVFTAQSGKVYGKSMVTSTDESKINPQLWRFEKEGNNYVFINKSTGTKMNLAYDSSKKIRNATLSATPVTNWEIIKNGESYNIKAATNISEGSTSNVYAHQASNWDGRAYVIMFESSSYNGTVNSKFNFVEYEKFELEYSTEGNDKWYYISSAKAEYKNKGITDVVDNSLPYIRFSLEEKEKDNQYQHWKVVKKNTGTKDELVHFVNRKTGNLIQAKSVENEMYKYTQATTDLDADKGWTASYLSAKQFVISGEEEDGVVRYLSASNSENKYPDFYDDTNNVMDTGFAWIFQSIDEYTDIPLINSENDNVKVYADNRYIIVEGADEYSIYTIQGTQVNKQLQLPIGIYLVKVNEKTVKILVK